ncbi:hypothetical protein PM082_016125 [Marasmius tenuissimus]|nr:hypothetical protein PM082_016125 [Marasmius tenuissimus]
MLRRLEHELSSELLNSTIGALEAGNMIACLLMGVVTIQTYYYYSKFPNDHVAVKTMVAFVWLCELGHSICISHATYVMTIVSWSDFRVLDSPPKTLSTAIFFAALSTPLIQSFLAWRIKGMAGSWTLTLMCWLMSLARMAMALISFVQGIKMTSLQECLREWGWSIIATIVIGAANDVVITLSLIWVLTQRRSATASKSTLAVIDTLILWTLETGLLTSVAGVLMMIVLLVMPHNFIWLAVFTFLAKLYSNSLMAVLTGRDTLREKAGNVVELYPATGQFGNSTFRVRRDTPRTTTQTSQPTDSDEGFNFGTNKTMVYEATNSIGNGGTTNILISRDVVRD